MASSVVIDNTPLFVDEDSYDGSQLSAPFSNAFRAEGVDGLTDFQVTFASGLGVNVNSGTAYVRGKNVSQQGLRKTVSTGSQLLTMDAADGTNPRIDTIVIRVYDDVNDSSGHAYSTIEILKGTPTASASLDNLLGAVNTITLGGSKSVLVLAYCQVNAANTPAFSGSYIQDNRPVATYGMTPPVVGNLTSDIVGMIPHPALAAQVTQVRANSFYGGYQSAALMWLPRDVLGANKLRWSYQNGDGTNGADSRITAGNYAFAICSAMGRKIVMTTAANFSTVAGSDNVKVESLTSNTDLYRGYYYVWFGVGSSMAGGSIYYPGIKLDSNWQNSIGGQIGMRCGLANLAFRTNTGGVTFGTTPANLISYMTDVSAGGPNTNDLSVPLVSLSKG